MMIMRAYSIFDSKAQAFLPPFFMLNDAVALRIFEECANDISHQFSKFPEDYVLYRVGDFHDDSGSFVPVDPVVLGRAIALKRPALVSTVKGECDE